MDAEPEPDPQPIPDSWPPPDVRATRVVPLFPLRGVYLFPGSIMPLIIFEPRYLSMIEDLLDGPGRLVLGTVEDESADMSGSPQVHDVAGLGEIGKHAQLPDGRYVIWLFGLGRVRIQEADSEGLLYRKVLAEPLEEVPVPLEMRKDLERELHDAILARKSEKEDLDLPDNLPVEFLTDYLLQRLSLPAPEMQELFAEPVVLRRTERVLEEHRSRPMKSGDAGEDDAGDSGSDED